MESITKKRNYNVDIFIDIKNKRREASFIPEGFTGATERGPENPCEKRTQFLKFIYCLINLKIVYFIYNK